MTTLKTEDVSVNNLIGCMFPVIQKGVYRAKWVTDETMKDTELQLVYPDAESGFSSGYVFVLAGMAGLEWAKELPGECLEVYIKEDEKRAKGKTAVQFIASYDMERFCKMLECIPISFPADSKSVISVANMFQATYWQTVKRLYISNPFDYWKPLTIAYFIPSIIEKGTCGDSKEGRPKDYWSQGGFSGTQQFTLTCYGETGEGIREVGRYIKEQTSGRFNESDVRKFLVGIPPLQCGPYIKGVKVNDRATYNNGGFGSDTHYTFLYDVEAVYKGVTRC